MSERIPLAIVGCGAVARRHLERLRKDHRAQIVALIDPDETRSAALRDELSPDAAIETDDALAYVRWRPTATILCSPTPLHAIQAARAFDFSLDVLCEKPLCPDRSQILELMAQAREAGRLLSVSYQRRYESLYTTARREVLSEWVGEIREVHIYTCERWQATIEGTWRDDPQLGAGYFGDAGSHQVDAALFITGRAPQAVLAESEKRGSNVEVVTRLFARLSGGVGLLAHFVGDAHHWREDIHVHGSKGDILLRDGRLWRARDNQLTMIPEEEWEPENDPDRGFLDAVQSRTPTVSGPECALVMEAWTRAVLESIDHKSWTPVES